MANPVVVICIKDEWVKVATNVTEGVIWILGSAPFKYVQSYRNTGSAPPIDVSEGATLDNGSVIHSELGIDVYVYAVSSDGRVRVDIA